MGIAGGDFGVAGLDPDNGMPDFFSEIRRSERERGKIGRRDWKKKAIRAVWGLSPLRDLLEYVDHYAVHSIDLKNPGRNTRQLQELAGIMRLVQEHAKVLGDRFDKAASLTVDAGRPE